MRFQRCIDGAVASDGGTISCRFLLDDGEIFECGLDARMPKTTSDRLVFVEGATPTSAKARLLLRNSIEEDEFVAALRDVVSRGHDTVAEMLLKAILDR